MASIEDRIVKIQFDNASFEHKLASTIASIQKLNTTLATAGSRNGLDTIAASSRNFNLHNVGASIEGISAKFLALGTIGVTVLSNITTKALTAAAQISKAFTFAPVISGFQEYELQIGSIQTILANTAREGTNLEDVTAALAELNTYADQTIYNFGEMTRNIGTFTAAGVDLDTSVQSIKGIANLAAISGSSSEQASTAMYQLSQAISTGSLRLIDWNSVVNAGMGGEVFQRALFETGVAMGTIADAPVGTSFEEWTAAGNVFRTSLDEGWLTADVLTTTLQGFTGEMTEAQLTAIGYTQEQAAEIMKLGEMGVDAATKVRTLTQLIATTKEAIGSGWSESFRIVVGDFEQATALWSDISDRIGEIVGNSAEARNNMLKTFVGLGGRTKLIWAIGGAFKAVFMLMKPIKDAFRQVFPPLGAQGLLNIVTGMQKLVVAMQPSGETANNMRRIFKGLFSALEIGWTILKEGIIFIKNLFQSITGAGGGKFLAFFAKIGDVFSKLNMKLVAGGGIADFFDGLAKSLERPIEIVKELKAAFVGLFDNLKIPSGLGDIFEGLGGIFGGLASAGADAGSSVGGMWGPLKEALGGVGDILSDAWDALVDFFSNMGSNLADVFDAPSFDSLLEVLDTALLGGILALLLKFSSGGLFSSFGGGIFSSISGAFGELTGTLKAMQADLRASALLKIAIAVGVLAVSLLLLSTIPADKLSDAMTALTVVFGLLIGAFAAIEKLSKSFVGAGSFALIAGGMILMAGAVLMLTGAIMLLSTLSWEELAKGLVGVAGALGLLVGAVLLLNFAKGSILGAGVGMLFIAAALVIMAGAVKLFSMMEWDEMIKGLVGVGGALAAVALGMMLMPSGILLQGAGLILIAGALNLIALAMKQMADLGWEEIGKGLTVIAGALAIIAATTYFMSPTLPLVGVGLILVAVSLKMIAGVMKELATLSWGDIAKGLVGITGALIAIGIAMIIASQGAAGALGIIGVAFALTMLIDVMQALAAMSWGEIIKGVGGIAIVLGVLGIAALLLAPAVAPLLGIAAAIFLIGAGFALFGAGVLFVAKAFELLARVGAKAVEVLIDAVEAVVEALPGLLEGVAESVLDFVSRLLEGAPKIIDELVKVLSSLLDGLAELIPKAGEVISLLITELLRIVREHFPELVQTGMDMLIALLTGIRDNIGEVVTLVADIITNFLDALALKVPEIIDSAYNLALAVIEGVVSKLVDLGELLAPKGVELLKGLLEGAKTVLPIIGAWFVALPGKVIGWLGDLVGWLVDKGGDLIAGLYKGATDWVTATLIPWLQDLPRKVFTWIGQTASSLLVRGANFIVGLYNGIINKMNEVVIPWLKALPGKVFTWIGDTVKSLAVRGKNFIVGLYNGIISKVNEVVIPWLKDLPKKVFTWIGETVSSLAVRGKNFIVGLYNGIISKMNEIVIPWLKGLPGKVFTWIGNTIESLVTRGKNLIVGLYNGIISKINEIVIPWLGSLPGKIISWIPNPLTMLLDVGKKVMEGLKDGLEAGWEIIKGWLGNLNPASWFNDINLEQGHAAKNLVPTGETVMHGLQYGMQEGWSDVETWLSKLNPADNMSKDLTSKMTKIVGDIVNMLDSIGEFQPTITPVLDLTLVRAGAAELAGMLPANASYLQAADIARSTRPGTELNAPTTTSGTGAVNFEQNIYAPQQLSTGDIYRQTRNQIALAKEELKIP